METYITSCYFVQISQSDFINFILDICEHYNIQSMQKQKITKEFSIVNKFGDLKVNVVYHMYDIMTINTKNGKAHIANFETEEEEKYVAWMPDSLVKNLKN